jgi:transcriptional regulator with PAS, ATPase and Fis domain
MKRPLSFDEDTLTVPGARRGIQVPIGEVRVVSGASEGKRVFVSSARVIVGTGEGTDLTLDDNGVSRLHCELALREDGVHMRDLGSKNGSWFAGSRIMEAVLAPNAQLGLGSSVLQVVAQRKVAKLAWAGGDRCGLLYGTSSQMHELFAVVSRVAPAAASVLITGETGTGKELLSRTVHALSNYRDGPFVVVDCGALNRGLAESELFGHEVGAFTGAVRQHPGAFERADGGTLFLDEIGELPLGLQVKLLRALQEKTVRRLGGEKTIEVDCRIVAATHRSLPKMVNDGGFREDLYFRLAIFQLEIPPLRERAADIAHLARGFVEAESDDLEEAWPVVEKALDAVPAYRWPGNVRELRAFVSRTILLGDQGVDMPGDEGDDLAAVLDLPLAEAKTRWMGSFERRYLERLLRVCSGNVSAAAKRAGVARSTLYEMIKRADLYS